MSTATRHVKKERRTSASGPAVVEWDQRKSGRTRSLGPWQEDDSSSVQFGTQHAPTPPRTCSLRIQDGATVSKGHLAHRSNRPNLAGRPNGAIEGSAAAARTAFRHRVLEGKVGRHPFAGTVTKLGYTAASSLAVRAQFGSRFLQDGRRRAAFSHEFPGSKQQKNAILLIGAF